MFMPDICHLSRVLVTCYLSLAPVLECLNTSTVQALFKIYHKFGEYSKYFYMDTWFKKYVQTIQY